MLQEKQSFMFNIQKKKVEFIIYFKQVFNLTLLISIYLKNLISLKERHNTNSKLKKIII